MRLTHIHMGTSLSTYNEGAAIVALSPNMAYIGFLIEPQLLLNIIALANEEQVTENISPRV